MRGAINRVDTVSFGLTSNVTSDGGSPVTARGVVYGTAPGVTLANASFTNDGAGTGLYQSNVFGLSPHTTYYVNAYATNNVGTVYGSEFAVNTTYYRYPVVMVDLLTSAVTSTSIALQANITSDGSSFITARGFCWDTVLTPTINSYHTVNGTGMGVFNGVATGLTPNTNYTILAYATNANGTVYPLGVNVSTSSVTAPVVYTDAAIQQPYGTSLVAGGTIVSSPEQIVARGVCWATTQNPTIAGNHTTDGAGLGHFTSTISGLTPSTAYYTKAYATGSSGTTYYGNQIQVATQCSTEYCRSQHAQGGIIVQLDTSGHHGLVVTDVSLIDSIPWYNGAYVTTNGTGTDGQVNTAAIIAAQGSGNYAAAYCDNLVRNGYSDWYLPSMQETQVWTSYYYNGFLGIYALGSIPYWTSTEVNSTTAYSFNGSGSGVYTAKDKALLYKIRAVRKF